MWYLCQEPIKSPQFDSFSEQVFDKTCAELCPTQSDKEGRGANSMRMMNNEA